MKMLSIKQTIYKFKTAEEFAAEFKIGVGDLVITNEYIYQPFFGKLNLGCDVLYQEKYGAGEPSDDMAEAMYKDIKGDHKRVIAIGGGTVIDISKLFALKTVSPILDLYDGKTEIVKDKELVLVPTTCGTGSEVTNIAILALNSRGTKKGLAEDEMYAFGHSVFNYSTNEIRTGNSKVLITSRQADILRLLALNVNKTVSRDTLLDAVWGTASYANSLALNVQMSYLRRSLKNDPSVRIESLMKKGYMLAVL